MITVILIVRRMLLIAGVLLVLRLLRLTWHALCFTSNSIGIHKYLWIPRWQKQCKSEGFDSCDRPSNLTQTGFKSSIFQPCDLESWLMTSKNYRAPLLHYIKLCASSQTSRWIRTAVAVRKRSIGVKIGHFFAPCNLEIQWMTLKNNRDPLLCYIKLWAS